MGIENADAFFVFSTLLTQTVDSWSGLVRYDGRLVEDICNLLVIEERFRCAIGGKVLYMISVFNEHRAEEQRSKNNPPVPPRRGDADGIS